MAYRALYRTYRPSLFKDVVGQKHIITILKNAVLKDRISHAYVFSGLRGIGKTTIARIFAKAVNCTNSVDGEPCDSCSECLSIINSETTDVIELDAASNNGVDQMREILEKVNFLPSFLKKKVYIIDEAHMLSTAAFNALLKTLEEPPAHVIFILATTEPYKIPSTILSRCQRLDFKQLTTNEIVHMLNNVVQQEQIQITDEALQGIAEASEGGMRDALSILDQARVYSLNKITLNDINSITGRVSQEYLIEIIKSLNDRNTQKLLDNVNLLIESGKEVSKILTSLIQFCRDLVMYKQLHDESLITYMYKKDEFVSLADSLSEERMFYYAFALSDIQSKVKYSNSPKIFLEIGLIKIISSANTDIDILAKIKKLEEKINLLNPSEGIESLNGILNRLDTIENKVKKITTEIEKNNFQGYKDAINSKISMLEDTVLANKTIPAHIEEKLQDLEEKMVEFKVTPSSIVNEQCENSNTFTEEEKNKILNIEKSILEINTSLEELKKQDKNVDLSEVNQRINELMLEHQTKIQIDSKDANDLINKQIDELRTEIKNINSSPIVDKPVDNSELESRMTMAEEYLDVIIATVDELSKTVKQTGANNSNYDSSNGEITQLNENYFVLLNLVKNLQDKVNATTPNIESSIDSESMTQFKMEMAEKLDNIIADLTNKILLNDQSATEKIGQLQIQFNGLIDEKEQIINEKIIGLEQKLSVETPDYSISINENKQTISDVKEYSINLSAKIQEIQNKVNEINTKLDGGITKRRSPFEFNNEEEKQPTTQNEETPKVSSPLPKNDTTIEKDNQQIISSRNTVVIKTKQQPQEKINETNNVYDIKIVERILYQAHDPKCKAEKVELLANWSKLENRVGHLLAPVAKLLSEGILAANGFKELLIVYPHASMCNHLMEPKGHLNALQVLRITFGKDYDFIALPENTWQEKRKEYVGQFYIGITYPKLTPINNPELKINQINTSNLFSKKNMSMHQAQDFFGADMVEKEEE